MHMVGLELCVGILEMYGLLIEHCIALLLRKYFFSLDKLNYVRKLPLYLAEMSQLERTYPEIWSEFGNGYRVVNKNTIPSCDIGLDYALEQINRWMKVTGGLVCISLNENARYLFFLISANLVRLTEEAKEMTRDSEAARKRHHELSQAY